MRVYFAGCNRAQRDCSDFQEDRSDVGAMPLRRIAPYGSRPDALPC
jgi:hypothetical protein